MQNKRAAKEWAHEYDCPGVKTEETGSRNDIDIKIGLKDGMKGVVVKWRSI